jgi:hypothetical protein
VFSVTPGAYSPRSGSIDVNGTLWGAAIHGTQGGGVYSITPSGTRNGERRAIAPITSWRRDRNHLVFTSLGRCVPGVEKIRRTRTFG